jgi:hypothetical protein
MPLQFPTRTVEEQKGQSELLVCGPVFDPGHLEWNNIACWPLKSRVKYSSESSCIISTSKNAEYDSFHRRNSRCHTVTTLLTVNTYVQNISQYVRDLASIHKLTSVYCLSTSKRKLITDYARLLCYFTLYSNKKYRNKYCMFSTTC